MLNSWISKECISYQVQRIVSSGWIIMRHPSQRCLCCWCSSYIAVIDRVNPLLFCSLESRYRWMGETPERRCWDDQCKLPTAATNKWVWEGLTMIRWGQYLQFWGLINGERLIEENETVLEIFKHAYIDLYHVWCEIRVFSMYICGALHGIASAYYAGFVFFDHTANTGHLHGFDIIVILVRSHLPVSRYAHWVHPRLAAQ